MFDHWKDEPSKKSKNITSTKNQKSDIRKNMGIKKYLRQKCEPLFWQHQQNHIDKKTR